MCVMVSSPEACPIRNEDGMGVGSRRVNSPSPPLSLCLVTDVKNTSKGAQISSFPHSHTR